LELHNNSNIYNYREGTATEDEEIMRAELEAKERKHLQSKRPRDSAGAIEDDTGMCIYYHS
jgi:hypothetical protein